MIRKPDGTYWPSPNERWDEMYTEIKAIRFSDPSSTFEALVQECGNCHYIRRKTTPECPNCDSTHLKENPNP